MRNMRLLSILLLISLFAAACGTQATPVPNSQTQSAQQTNQEPASTLDEEQPNTEIAVVPTDTPAPTNSPAPPTEAPTETPLAEETPVEATEAPQQSDQITRLVQAFGDPASGETLFNTNFTTAQGDWACITCHNADSPDRKIGPGFLDLRERAEDRIEDQTAEQYVYNSIIHPNEFIAPGDPEYPPNVMPQNYEEVFTEQQLYDLTAYLLSLGE